MALTFERYDTDSAIVARLTDLRAKGFSFESSCGNADSSAGFSPVVIAYKGQEIVKIRHYAMTAPYCDKPVHANQLASNLIDQIEPSYNDYLTPERAIAYVEETFAGSFDSILDCDMSEDCGQIVAMVKVMSKGTIQHAHIWQTGKTEIYGEL